MIYIFVVHGMGGCCLVVDAAALLLTIQNYSAVEMGRCYTWLVLSGFSCLALPQVFLCLACMVLVMHLVYDSVGHC